MDALLVVGFELVFEREEFVFCCGDLVEVVGTQGGGQLVDVVEQAGQFVD